MLTIRLVSQAGGAPASMREASFGQAGGDIGRGADCTLVLPDPERRISRKHLQVAFRDERFFLRLISTNLLVELDGVPLAPGVECPLDPGAQVRIGPFVLRAEAQAAAAAVDDDALGLLNRSERPGRPGVFHDLLRAAVSPPAPLADAAASEVDLLVGDPTGAGLAAGPGTAATVPASAADAIAALYKGLGLPAPAPGSASAEQIELIGALLRASVGGTLGLLAGRTIAKRELGASPTMIQTRQNNPLKFSPDVNLALAQLLGPPRRGFIPPLLAVRDAFDDLRAHEVAVLAGMRAALSAVLDRVAPAALEQRWAEKGMWDNLLPVNHKARLWERYSEQHAAIAREIEGNFDAVFAGAFIDAYEAQLQRLADARPP